MWEDSGASVARRNTGLLDDPKWGSGRSCINPAFVIYCVCGRIFLGRNLPRNRGRVQSLHPDRKLK